METSGWKPPDGALSWRGEAPLPRVGTATESMRSSARTNRCTRSCSSARIKHHRCLPRTRRARAHTHTHTSTHAYTNTHRGTCVDAHANKALHAAVQQRARTHTHRSAGSCTYTHARPHARTHARTHGCTKGACVLTLRGGNTDAVLASQRQRQRAAAFSRPLPSLACSYRRGSFGRKFPETSDRCGRFGTFPVVPVGSFKNFRPGTSAPVAITFARGARSHRVIGLRFRRVWLGLRCAGRGGHEAAATAVGRADQGAVEGAAGTPPAQHWKSYPVWYPARRGRRPDRRAVE